MTSTYDPTTGAVLTRQEGTATSLSSIQNLAYVWDASGNLQQRQDLRQGLTEVFVHDGMNRLSSSTLNGTTNLTVGYDAAGNITSKSDVSTSPYVYGDSAHPHAVTAAGSWTMSYDANGNMKSRAGGAISWYSYNQPNLIQYGTSSAQFNYDAGHQRWRQIASYAGTMETTYYVGGMLEVKSSNGVTEYRHQIPAGSNTAFYTRRSDGTSGTYYASSDHLGSADVVLDGSANVLARESFTPFGARRGANWQAVPSTSDYAAFSSTTRRGFTGQEMLDSVSLVHMNGRVYDPYLGRFLSPDSIIQTLGSSQSINPYAYGWNSPLRYVDPSGHSLLGDILGAVLSIVVAYFTFGASLAFFSSELGAFWGGVAASAFSGFVGGFVGAAISTGSLSAALTAGLIGGLTAGLFNAAGSVFAGNSNWQIGERALAHAAVGCASAAASGGNCGKGALSAAVAGGATEIGLIKPAELGTWASVRGTAEAGLLGGITARLAGGNAAEGFSVGASGYIFNSLAHMLVGQDAHSTLAIYLARRDPGLWGSNTTWDGAFGFYRADLVYSGNPGETEVYEIKPAGSDAAGEAQLQKYLAVSADPTTVAGDNNIIFRGQPVLTLSSPSWWGGTTQYSYYPSLQYPGVVVYEATNQNIFSMVASWYAQGNKKQSLQGVPPPVAPSFIPLVP